MPAQADFLKLAYELHHISSIYVGRHYVLVDFLVIISGHSRGGFFTPRRGQSSGGIASSKSVDLLDDSCGARSTHGRFSGAWDGVQVLCCL